MTKTADLIFDLFRYYQDEQQQFTAVNEPTYLVCTYYVQRAHLTRKQTPFLFRREFPATKSFRKSLKNSAVVVVVLCVRAESEHVFLWAS